MSDSATRATAALRAIDDWIGPRGVSAAGAVVMHHDEIVAERYAGEIHPGTPVTDETLFALASITKPITAATVLALVDAGAVSLDEPVSRLVPEFGSRAIAEAPEANPSLEALRPNVAIWQLLCHVSGLPEDLAPRDERFRGQVPLATLIDAMCRLPLQSASGVEVRYSNAGYGVLTRLVERLTGEPFWDVARRHVLDPLDLRDIYAQPGPFVIDRIAPVADPANPGTDTESYNSPYWRDLAIPWGGLYGTPRALARFATSFLPTYEEPRALSLPAARLMTTDQTGGVPGGIESGKVRWRAASWGLGWEVKGNKRRHWTGDLTSPATYCHFGQAGTLLWADPALDLVFAIFANRTVTRHWTFYLNRWARLSNAIVAAVAR